MSSTKVDRISPSGLCAEPELIEHIQVLHAQHHNVYNISKLSMRSNTVDRTYPNALCAAPQWIEHLQVVCAQHHSE